MTDEPMTTGSDTNSPATAEAVMGIVTDGAHTLLVAQFPTTEEAEAAYEGLSAIERNTSLRIDGVVIATCDAEGKVHLGKVTEHSTKTGLTWGIVGGAIAGVIFPPSILASAAGFGLMGAAAGKIHNIFARAGLADELAGVMRPNTAGIVALVEDEAVVEIRKALLKADRIVEKAIDEQLAREIDREASAAKESLTST